MSLARAEMTKLFCCIPDKFEDAFHVARLWATSNSHLLFGTGATYHHWDYVGVYFWPLGTCRPSSRIEALNRNNVTASSSLRQWRSECTPLNELLYTPCEVK